MLGIEEAKRRSIEEAHERRHHRATAHEEEDKVAEESKQRGSAASQAREENGGGDDDDGGGGGGRGGEDDQPFLDQGSSSRDGGGKASTGNLRVLSGLRGSNSKKLFISWEVLEHGEVAAPVLPMLLANNDDTDEWQGNASLSREVITAYNSLEKKFNISHYTSSRLSDEDYNPPQYDQKYRDEFISF